MERDVGDQAKSTGHRWSSHIRTCRTPLSDTRGGRLGGALFSGGGCVLWGARCADLKPGANCVCSENLDVFQLQFGVGVGVGGWRVFVPRDSMFLPMRTHSLLFPELFPLGFASAWLFTNLVPLFSPLLTRDSSRLGLETKWVESHPRFTRKDFSGFQTHHPIQKS